MCVCACNIFHLMMLEILLCVTEKEFQLFFSVVFRSWSWWRDRSRKMRYCYILFFALILGCAVCVCLSVSCLHVHATTKSWISGCLSSSLSLFSLCACLCLSFALIHSFWRFLTKKTKDCADTSLFVLLCGPPPTRVLLFRLLVVSDRKKIILKLLTHAPSEWGLVKDTQKVKKDTCFD